MKESNEAWNPKLTASLGAGAGPNTHLQPAAFHLHCGLCADILCTAEGDSEHDLMLRSWTKLALLGHHACNCSDTVLKQFLAAVISLMKGGSEDV